MKFHHPILNPVNVRLCGTSPTFYQNILMFLLEVEGNWAIHKSLPFFCFLFLVFVANKRGTLQLRLYLCPCPFLVCFAELQSSYESLWDEPISSFPRIRLLSPTIVGLYHLQDEGSPMSCWGEVQYYFTFNMRHFSRQILDLPIWKGETILADSTTWNYVGSAQKLLITCRILILKVHERAHENDNAQKLKQRRKASRKLINKNQIKTRIVSSLVRCREALNLVKQSIPMINVNVIEMLVCCKLWWWWRQLKCRMILLGSCLEQKRLLGMFLRFNYISQPCDTLNISKTLEVYAGRDIKQLILVQSSLHLQLEWNRHHSTLSFCLLPYFSCGLCQRYILRMMPNVSSQKQFQIDTSFIINAFSKQLQSEQKLEKTQRTRGKGKEHSPVWWLK